MYLPEISSLRYTMWPCDKSALFLGQTLNPWMPAVLSIATLRHSMTPLPPVDISALVALNADCCEPPMTRVPRGHSRKERFRKEDTRVRRGVAASLLHCDGDLDALGSQVLVSRCKTCGETVLWTIAASTKRPKNFFRTSTFSIDIFNRRHWYPIATPGCIALCDYYSGYIKIACL